MSLFIDGRWEGPAAAGLCRTENLSLGGCFVRTPAPPAVNDLTLVTLYFPERGTIPIEGQVVRAESGVGFGMRFGEMRPETRYQLGEEITQIRRKTSRVLSLS